MYKLNCVDAGRSLIARGFLVVQQIHCQGNTYAFVALRRGKPYRVVMDPWSGTIERRPHPLTPSMVGRRRNYPRGRDLASNPN